MIRVYRVVLASEELGCEKSNTDDIEWKNTNVFE